MKKLHIIALVVIAVAMGAMITMSGQFSTYETFASAELRPKKEFRVVGELVKEKEVYYNPQENPNYFSFYMRDKDGNERKVERFDALPRDFERSEEVVIVGKVGPEAFVATDMLIKCPSKYVDTELELEGAQVYTDAG